MPAGTTMTACPYCGSHFAVAAGLTPNQRIVCPRCEESFEYRAPLQSEPVASDAVNSVSTTVTSADEVDSFRSNLQLLTPILILMGGAILLVVAAYGRFLFSPLADRRDWQDFALIAVSMAGLFALFIGTALGWLWFFRIRRTNGATAYFVLANMLVLASLSLGGALMTRDYRRHIDAGLPARPKRTPYLEDSNPTEELVAPARWAALAYLPPGTDLAAGVEVRRLLALPAGKALLQRPITLGGVSIRLADMPQKLGLAEGDVDQIVIGMHTANPLSAVLVVRTQSPLNRDGLQERLHARRLPTSGHDTLLEWKIEPWKVPVLTKLVDDKTLAISLATEELETLQAPASVPTDRLSAPVADLLRTRVDTAASVWFVGQIDDWSKTPLALGLARLAPPEQNLVQSTRALAGWAQVTHDGAEVDLNIRCQDAAATQALDRWFASRLSAEKGNKSAIDGTDPAWLLLQSRRRNDGALKLFFD